MQAGQWATNLKPFGVLNDRNAVSTLYKSLEIAPDSVTGFAHWGVLTVELETGLDDVCYVDTAAFLAVLRSLEPKSALQFSLSKGVLNWNSGNLANGRIATVDVENAPDMPRVKSSGEYETTGQFKEALELGALGADRPSIKAAGLYRVMLDNTSDALKVCSTDNVVIAIAEAGPTSEHLPERFSMHPQAVETLAAVVDAEHGAIRIDDDALCYTDGLYTFGFRKYLESDLDILATASAFSREEDTTTIERDRIAAFLRRVYALGDSRNDAWVSLGAEDGHLVLSFTEHTASATEYFVGGKGIPNVQPQPFKAVNIARALSSADRVVLDHLKDEERRVLVLRGSEPEFAFYITT